MDSYLNIENYIFRPEFLFLDKLLSKLTLPQCGANVVFKQKSSTANNTKTESSKFFKFQYVLIQSIFYLSAEFKKNRMSQTPAMGRQKEAVFL